MQGNHRKSRRRIRFTLSGLGLAMCIGLGTPGPVWAVGSPSSPSRLTGVVNVNQASAAELQLLPGVGPARAQAILELRQRRGGFQSLDDLTGIEGIGPASLRAMRPHLVLKGKTTARRRPTPQSPRP